MVDWHSGRQGGIRSSDRKGDAVRVSGGKGCGEDGQEGVESSWNQEEKTPRAINGVLC